MMAATSGGHDRPTKSVGFADNIPDTENEESRQNKEDPSYADYRHGCKDEDLCKKMIMEDLGKDGHQKVFLTGKAGIGKTRLAKKVAEYATENGSCFLTIYLHLNKTFENELSLYENIASQLSLYSDFEETQVDDRDEDEEDEKKLDENDFKKMIIDGILKQKSESDIEKGKADKRKKEEADKREKKMEADKRKKKEEADKTNKTLGNKKTPDKKDKTTQLEKKTTAQGEKKTPYPYLLLILDDEGNKTTENAVMKCFKLEEFLKDLLLKLEKFLNELLLIEDQLIKESRSDMLLDDTRIFKVDTNLKVLVTRRKGYEEAPKPGGENELLDTKTQQGDNTTTESKTEPAGEIQLHDTNNEGTTAAQSTENDGGSGPSTGASSNVETTYNIMNRSKDLFDTINDDNYLRDLFWSLTEKEDWETYKEFIPEIVKRSKKSPAAIVVLANSLTRITQSKKPPSMSDEDKKKQLDLKAKIDQKIREALSADRSDLSSESSSSDSGINPILYLAYELLETNQIDRPSMDAILDCFWHSLDFFEQCGCVYYRDLITQWILEGYFDPVKSVEKAYQDGHSILLELINRSMLKIQENNVVVPEMAMINLIDPRRRGHLGRSRLGFSRVYGGDKKKGIGKITQLDDMIKTVQAKKGDIMTTILVSGDRLRRETPKKYFAKLAQLEVLGLFEPTLHHFLTSFKHLVQLRVLVIRDFDLLESIEDLRALTKLNALEVSGASSLNNISDGFFNGFHELQSLHLSGLKITSSPSSISELKKLHCLIIKDCCLLEDLPNIQELEELEVVDISGARGLQTCFDNTKGEKKDKSKNKNFYKLTNLQLLDFSESQIERLPIFQDSAVADEIHSLTRLLLRNCSKLRRLPSLKPLSGLQILDLSGTTSLVEMLEVCFENKKELKILDLSGTNLSELATTIEELSSLNKLLLKNCINLEGIPNIQDLTNLEVIDVSGSTKLKTIDGSFEGMSYLREVNLFRTKVKTPELPKESKIHCLKRITLADGRQFEGKDWNEVRKTMSSETPEDPSSSDAVVKSQEISEEGGKIQSVEPRASDCTDKEDVNKKRLLQVPRDKEIYNMALSLVTSESPQRVMEINETSELDEVALDNAEYVSFVDCSPTRLTSVFDKTKSVKGCWLRMCIDIKDLFSGVDEERLGLLETLSITNLPSLETISCVASFKSLEKLSIDCCPKIITLFPEASELPSSLKDLHIKDCEKLEKVVKGVEVSTHTNVTVKQENCPNFNKNSISSDYVMVEHSDASLQN